jgi:hypothetical protein
MPGAAGRLWRRVWRRSVPTGPCRRAGLALASGSAAGNGAAGAPAGPGGKPSPDAGLTPVWPGLPLAVGSSDLNGGIGQLAMGA